LGEEEIGVVEPLRGMRTLKERRSAVSAHSAPQRFNWLTDEEIGVMEGKE